MTDFDKVVRLGVPVETCKDRATAAFDKFAAAVEKLAPGKPNIRAMRESDIPELLEIENASFPDEPYTEDTFDGWVGSGGGVVAQVGDKLVAYLLHRSENGFEYAHSIAVHPDHRRKGLGQALIRHLMDAYDHVSADVDTDNGPSNGMFKKLGFKTVRTYSHPGRTITGKTINQHRMHYSRPEKSAALTVAKLTAAAKETNPDPTDAQKEHGRYKKGRVSWKGLVLAIETAKGEIRSGKAPDGTAWQTTMRDHYGYISGTESDADGDAIDFFLNDDNLDSELVFIVNQKKKDGTFDEHKCVLGCVSREDAKKTYLRNYSAGWTGMGEVTPITLDHFKWWMEYADTSKEVKNGFFAAKANLKREKKAADPITGDGFNVTIDRPKGFKKTFHTKAGPKELEYPLDYGYFPGTVNPEDNEDADVFMGTGGPLHGRFMKGKPGPDGAMVPDERKWYAGLQQAEYETLKNWWETQHDTGLTWDWTDLGNREKLLADAGVKAADSISGEEELPYRDRAEILTHLKGPRTVTTLVPRNTLDSVRKNGLLGGKALIENPDALAAAAQGRGTTPEAFKADVQSRLASWKAYQSLGPNIFFQPPPKGKKFAANHPTKIHGLVSLKVRLDDLMRDVPDTKMYGMELEPYDEKKHAKGTERHRYLEQEELSRLMSKSPDELWQHYADPEGKGYYAPDVPHGSIHTPNAMVPSKYIDFPEEEKAATDDDGRHRMTKLRRAGETHANIVRLTPEDIVGARIAETPVTKKANSAFEYDPILWFVKRGADEHGHPFTIAVDLDGTLAKQEKPFNVESVGEPITKAVKWVRRFHAAGARIIIFTVRGSIDLVRDWLEEHEVPFDYINENPDQPPNSSGKVFADVYWDDRAYNAVDPDEHGPEILRRAKEHSKEEPVPVSGSTLITSMEESNGGRNPGVGNEADTPEPAGAGSDD